MFYLQEGLGVFQWNGGCSITGRQHRIMVLP